jgi:hypothetical protein
MIIIKGRNSVVNSWSSWQVYHASLTNPATSFVRLNETSATYTGFASAWNSTIPTSSVFSISYAGGAGVNGSGDTFVAFCWAEIAGFSKFGSYTANASADGPFIYTGFRPRWIMFKRSTSSTNWYVIDTSISPYNASTTGLYPNTSSSESTEGAVDILSNGFKCRASSGAFNYPGNETFIYAAYAENPFKNALAR